MSYADSAALSRDADFADRAQACLNTEAQGKPDGDVLAPVILRSASGYGASLFMPFLSTAPGFADAYAAGGQAAIDDSMLLSAVQANWDAVAALQPVQP